jgi:hypothetical protein
MSATRLAIETVSWLGLAPDDERYWCTVRLALARLRGDEDTAERLRLRLEVMGQ